MDEFLEDRDQFLDALEAELERRVPIIFGTFLADVPDDPAQVPLDVILLLLITEHDKMFGALPFAARAREINAQVGIGEGRTVGLEQAREQHISSLRAFVGSIAADLAVKTSQMAAQGIRTGAREAMAELLERKRAAIVAQVLTTVMAFERQVLGALADTSDDVVYVYTGPRDRKNREFCRAILDHGVAYRRPSIEVLNGHPLLHSYVPPLVFSLCGGINCRHIFYPIPGAVAKDRGLTIV